MRMTNDGGPGPVISRRLGYLFKHAGRRMDELNAEALAPFGIDSRELGILLVIAGQKTGSQQQAAERLGIDRTSMVAAIDALEEKGLVSRRPDAEDRRRNVVTLTDAGETVVKQAAAASEGAEAAMLAPLGPREQERLRKALQVVVLRP